MVIHVFTYKHKWIYGDYWSENKNLTSKVKILIKININAIPFDDFRSRCFFLTLQCIVAQHGSPLGTNEHCTKEETANFVLTVKAADRNEQDSHIQSQTSLERTDANINTLILTNLKEHGKDSIWIAFLHEWHALCKGKPMHKHWRSQFCARKKQTFMMYIDAHFYIYTFTHHCIAYSNNKCVRHKVGSFPFYLVGVAWEMKIFVLKTQAKTQELIYAHHNTTKKNGNPSLQLQPTSDFEMGLHGNILHQCTYLLWKLPKREHVWLEYLLQPSITAFKYK